MFTCLFDIDGTLIRTGGAGVAALKSTLHSEFPTGHSAIETEISGRTDRAIVRDMFLGHGVEDSQDNWERFQTAYLGQLSQKLLEIEGCVLPGIVELLDELSRRRDAKLGLLTGNTANGARSKLEHYGLFHYFSFGAYGDQRLDRDDIARDAYRTIQQRFDGRITPQQVWVIGDTPLDIRCARAIGARVAAVATGSHSREELAECGPDALFDDLTSTLDVLSYITA